MKPSEMPPEDLRGCWPKSGVPYWTTVFWVLLIAYCVLGDLFRNR